MTSVCVCVGTVSGSAEEKNFHPPMKNHHRSPSVLPSTAQQQHFSSGSIRCRYSECQRSATVADARRTFKTCHNCNHMYCSKRCRRAHWHNHRKTCLNRRTATLCRSIVDAVKKNGRCVERLSTIARRGYLTHGRGTVKCYFSGIELADRFIRDGDDMQCDPVYAKCADIDPELDALQQLCKTYDPDSRFVLHVSVCVQSEVPGPGPVQWERHVVYKSVKLHLDKSLRRPVAVADDEPLQQTDDGCRESTHNGGGSGPDTLILTSLPGYDRRDVRTARRVCFVNVQRHLRQRGVELRQQFPDVYQKLCDYVDGGDEVTFTPVTVYPRDRVSGKTFMCVIMPDTEPEKLNVQLSEHGAGVQTVDVGRAESAAHQ